MSATIPTPYYHAGAPRAVVGLDCEWRPYPRGQPHTPVALLQLAVQPWRLAALPSDGSGPPAAQGELQEEQQQEKEAEGAGDEEWGQPRVFLLDMLALCSAGAAGPACAARPLGTAPAGAALALVEGEGEAAPECRLSALLRRAFGDPALIKVGFKFR